jgi:hypothetical protein
MKTVEPVPSKRMVEVLMKELSQRNYNSQDPEYAALCEEEEALTKKLFEGNPRLRAIEKAKKEIDKQKREEEKLLSKKLKKIRQWYFASGDIAKAVKELKVLVAELNKE